MGRGDIISIIIKKLKKLSKELNIPILVTAPANIETREFKENPIKALSYFCKEQSAKDYVDKIILINGNIKDNNMNFIKKNKFINIVTCKNMNQYKKKEINESIIMAIDTDASKSGEESAFI